MRFSGIPCPCIVPSSFLRAFLQVILFPVRFHRSVLKHAGCSGLRAVRLSPVVSFLFFFFITYVFGVAFFFCSPGCFVCLTFVHCSGIFVGSETLWGAPVLQLARDFCRFFWPSLFSCFLFCYSSEGYVCLPRLRLD